MFSRKEAIFRKEALERLSSPERLDELVAIVDPHSWIALVTLALLIATALVWSVVARLPITVTGRGILLQPSNATSQAVAVLYFDIREGSRLEPGMRTHVVPDSVDRQRYGSIAGTVRSVSPSPVTKGETTSLAGQSAVAASFLSDGPRMEVIVNLESDPSTVSGYRWSSSKGPPRRIGSGMTVTARVTVEERAPITYLLPPMRSNAGAH